MRDARLPALLLLVYPATVLVSNAFFAIEWGEWYPLLYEATLLGLAVMAAVGLWLRADWAYGLALMVSFLAAFVRLATNVAVTLMKPGWIEGPVGWGLKTVVVILACGAAFFLLLRPSRRETFTEPLPPRVFWGVVGWAAVLEAGLMVLIAIFGLGGFDSAPHQGALYLSQGPGIFILEDMGLCCGYDNHMVLSDVLDVHWGGLTPVGIPILMAANAVGFAGLALLARAGWRGRRSFPRGLAPFAGYMLFWWAVRHLEYGGSIWLVGYVALAVLTAWLLYPSVVRGIRAVRLARQGPPYTPR